MRPRRLSEFIGQEHILAPGRLLRRAIEADQITSIVLSGPPGTGKTTLARVIADHTRSQFLSINAVLSGVKELRAAIADAKSFRDLTNRRTILFVDEVHRWNRAQQDALLPWVEEGLIILIGATTENPFFEVNRALLSRSRVFLLKPLSEEELRRVLAAALADRERGYGHLHVEVTPEAETHLIGAAAGDARTLLNALELAVETSGSPGSPAEDAPITIDLSVAEDSIQQRAVLYDKDGDYHFDTISALIKSIRGSDPDAALYWLAKMVLAGEDPHYIFRRLLIQASEDVGLADPEAITVVTACAAAFDRVGMPEGQFHLAQAVLYLANAEKSNTTLAYFDAVSAISAGRSDEIPSHLRDANRDGASLGHGDGYLYPHAYRDHWVAQQYLPASLQGRHFYQPGHLGWEGRRAEVLRERRRLQLAITQEEDEPGVWTVGPRRGPDAAWTRRAEGTRYTQLRDLRDRLVAAAAPESTDRVLLAGAGVAPLVWEMVRRAAGGGVRVWAPAAIIETLQAGLEDDRDRVEAPQLTAGDGPPDADRLQSAASGTMHAGPFELIVCRSFRYEDPPAWLRCLPELLAPGGRALIVDVVPQEGTRPSDLLPLDPADRELLATAEEQTARDPDAEWTTATAQTPSLTIDRSTIEITVQRTISRDQAQQWVGPDGALGRRLREIADADTVARILAAAGRLDEGPVAWTRAHRLLTLRVPTA